MRKLVFPLAVVVVAVVIYFMFYLVKPAHDTFRFFRNIESTANGYVRVPLDPMIYKYCKPDFSDVRLVNKRGLDVPYFIYTTSTPLKTKATTNEAIFINTANSDDGISITFAMLAIEKPINFISLDIKNDSYVFKVTVQNSPDKERWYDVDSEDMIYSFPMRLKNQKNTIATAPMKYCYCRLTLKKMSGDMNADAIKKITYSSRYYDPLDVELQPLKIVAAPQGPKENSENVIYLDTDQVAAHLDRLIFDMADKEFSTQMDIYGSETLGGWKLITKGAEIYSFNDKNNHFSKQYVNIPITRYRYLKCTWKSNKQENIVFQKVFAQNVSEYIVFNNIPGDSFKLYYGSKTFKVQDYKIAKLSDLLEINYLPVVFFQDDPRQQKFKKTLSGNKNGYAAQGGSQDPNTKASILQSLDQTKTTSNALTIRLKNIKPGSSLSPVFSLGNQIYKRNRSTKGDPKKADAVKELQKVDSLTKYSPLYNEVAQIDKKSKITFESLLSTKEFEAKSKDIDNKDSRWFIPELTTYVLPFDD